MDARRRISRLGEKRAALSPAETAAMRQDAGRYLAAIIAASFGTGVLGRSLLGANRLMYKSPKVTADNVATSLVLPQHDDEQKAQMKFAGDGAAVRGNIVDIKNPKSGALNTFGNMLANVFFNAKDKDMSAWSSPTSIPTFWPLAAGGGLAAMYGGYKLTDTVLDSRRAAELQAELDAAKQKYQQAVQLRLKAAEHVADTAAPELLDELAVSGYWKQAGFPEVLNKLKQGTTNLAGNVTGLYLAYALLSGLGSGKLVYDQMRKRAPRKITEKALEERSRQRFGMTPPVYVSQPVEATVAP